MLTADEIAFLAWVFGYCVLLALGSASEWRFVDRLIGRGHA